jgi:hypothetical protein
MVSIKSVDKSGKQDESTTFLLTTSLEEFLTRVLPLISNRFDKVISSSLKAFLPFPLFLYSFSLITMLSSCPTRAMVDPLDLP